MGQALDLKAPYQLHIPTTLVKVQVDPKQKVPLCGIFAEPLPDSNRRPLLFLRQLMATHGNGFRLSEPFSTLPHLPPVATGCNRSAP
jgi:hypothetical protein